MIGHDGAYAGTGNDGFDLQVVARPENLHTVRRALERLGLPATLLEDARLLTTELVTNSLRHARLGPDDRIRVAARWSGAKLRVTVRDRPTRMGSGVVVGSIRPPPGAKSGWGLYLVDELATRWGTSLDGTPCFWFEIELPRREGG